jgi:methionine-gamma-lyase
VKNPVQSMRDVQHFGEEGGVVPVIDLAVTSTFLNPEDMERAFHGELPGCYLYSRHSNPTVNAFGKKLAALEGMEAALGVASGMAAINCTIRQLMPDGGHLISSQMIYGGTYALFQNILPKSAINVSFVDMTDLGAIERAITPETRIIYTETMSNPLLQIANLPRIKDLCAKQNIKLVVDNTFTPVIISPAKFGADVVLYSCTKYISGASDLMAGAIVSSQEFINQLIDINHGMVMLTGPGMDARIAHELYLRLDHLPVRMAAHSKSARYLVERVAKEKIPLIYPGLPSHTDHKVMNEIMNPEFGYGGMVVMDCKTVKRALDFASNLQQEKFGLYAVSLGFSRTLISCPSITTSSEIPQAEQETMGLSPGLLRLSIGFTGDDQIMAQRFIDCYRRLDKTTR